MLLGANDKKKWEQNLKTKEKYVKSAPYYWEQMRKKMRKILKEE